MLEFAVCSSLLLAFCILVGRKGHRHFLRPGLPWGMIAAGALAGYLLESLPFTTFRAAPSVQTLLAVVAGLLAGRLAARGGAGWAKGQERDLVLGHAPAIARLVHPLVAAGLWLSGTAILWTLVCARHETLEVFAQPRDPETLVLRGAEEVSLDGDPALSHAVVLVHGFLGSPADFGDLPQRLHAKGFTVRAIRLPGHGTVPSALAEQRPEDLVKAVDDARAVLEGRISVEMKDATPGEVVDAISDAFRKPPLRHEKVSIVGFSVGGMLALRSAANSPPHGLVLVNPYIGELHTPPWSPFSTDAMLPVAAKLTRRVIRPPGMTRCNDPAGVLRQRAYFTVPLGAFAAISDSVQERPLAAPPCPTLLVLSREDQTTPSPAAEAWYGAAKVPPTRDQVVFHASNHLIFLDHDRDAAIDAVVSWLTRSR